jgi:hypothetical protein
MSGVINATRPEFLSFYYEPLRSRRPAAQILWVRIVCAAHPFLFFFQKKEKNTDRDGFALYRFGRYPCPSSFSIHPRCRTPRSVADRTPLSERHVTLSVSCCGRSDWPSRPCLTRKRLHRPYFLFGFVCALAWRCGKILYIFVFTAALQVERPVKEHAIHGAREARFLSNLRFASGMC